MNKYTNINSVQFSSVTQQCPTLHDPTDCSTLASLSITNSQSSLKLTSVSLVMPSNDLILCHPLLLLPSGFPSIRVFSSESVLHIKWPKYWSFSISPSNEYSGLISFKIARDSQEFKSINSSELSFLYGPALPSIHDCWKNNSFNQMDLCW